MENLEKQTIETVKKVAPAVVSIVIAKMVPEVRKIQLSPPIKSMDQIETALPDDALGNHLPVDHHGAPQKVKIGGGSGFIVDASGIILTNKHVVYEADAQYTVLMNDGAEYPARVLTRDPINDVAVLKIEGTNLPTVTLGDSDKIELGQTAIAIGNALGLFSNTVSKGIVSGLGRKISAALGQGGQIENLRHVIQTDVAINQGNSGGPLVNLDGEVIGINTAIIFGAQNIGFALPINWAKIDLEELIKYGRIVRPYIGLRYVTLNPEIKERYGLATDYGALVTMDHIPGSTAVVKGSPADKAGLRENDIVLEINGMQLSEKHELADVVESSQVGDKLMLFVLRGDEKITLPVTLEERT